MLHRFSAAPRGPLPILLGRWLRGLERADLLADLSTGGPYTLVAPVDRAFDRLPWSFDELLEDAELVEPFVDLFEYTVVRGELPADGPLRRANTLRGEPIDLGQRVVIGPASTVRIAASLRVQGFTVHVTDACALPTTVLSACERAPWRTSRALSRSGANLRLLR